ncbi:anaerobic ribonucleoside-triphosphate reductase [Chitinolyticbacter albus]|uniref:anaerobic ribonucleoside-triphosphate reductase n=1 Tax=Chitinolyticbacter albus TaxID=2961951 RepID=UPI00210B38DE|nr:anaerobic ribonucleoside-triphosphate reductase [Chitinolyticbacter albus]
MTDLSEQRHLASDAPSIEALPDELRTRCEVWTRVMGYHRPVSAFNTGKQGEFAERTFFRER